MFWLFNSYILGLYTLIRGLEILQVASTFDLRKKMRVRLDCFQLRYMITEFIVCQNSIKPL